MQTSNRIKVLNINIDNNPYGGVPVFLMNVFRCIDHERIQYDFLTSDESSYHPYLKEIKQECGEVYALHIDFNSLYGKLRYGKKLHTFLKNHPYDIVHINSGAVSFDCISTIVAKSNGAKVIVHSHSAGGRSCWKQPVAFLMKLLMQLEADVLCACSKAAAKNTFTYGKANSNDVVIIKNGIDLQRFQFSEGTRQKIRKELNIEGRFVIGHVGRFTKEKNHEFLIDIFAGILSKNPSAVLLLVGQGELESKIRDKVRSLHIENNVIFCGGRDDVENYYQVMDVFLFPSISEGLGTVLIEAQAGGLPCVISDTITSEVNLTSLIHRVSLKESSNVWANKVLSVSVDSNKRNFYGQKLKEAGYSIEDTTLQISKLYENLIYCTHKYGHSES